MSIAKYDYRLIQRPQNVPLVHRTLWGAATAIFWAAYLYLWLPAITMLAWLLGLREGWIRIYRDSDQVDPFVFVSLPLICAACALLVIAWAEYNRRRFSGVERRMPMPETPHEEIARGLGTTPELARRLAASRVVTVVMGEDARPVALLEEGMAAAA